MHISRTTTALCIGKVLIYHVVKTVRSNWDNRNIIGSSQIIPCSGLFQITVQTQKGDKVTMFKAINPRAHPILIEDFLNPQRRTHWSFPLWFFSFVFMLRKLFSPKAFCFYFKLISISSGLLDSPLINWFILAIDVLFPIFQMTIWKLKNDFKTWLTIRSSNSKSVNSQQP